jgi:hypothetical protein
MRRTVPRTRVKLFWSERQPRWISGALLREIMMLFIHELASRGVRAYMTDPGATDTDITRGTNGLLHWLGEHKFARFAAHSAAKGARASIQAVTTDLPSGSYLVPRFSQYGKPKVTKPQIRRCFCGRSGRLEPSASSQPVRQSTAFPTSMIGFTPCG